MLNILMVHEALMFDILGAIGEQENASSINRASHSQTVCTAIQLGLIELLKEWGLTPEAVIGHSSGKHTGSQV